MDFMVYNTMVYNTNDNGDAINHFKFCGIFVKENDAVLEVYDQLVEWKLLKENDFKSLDTKKHTINNLEIYCKKYEAHKLFGEFGFKIEIQIFTP